MKTQNPVQHKSYEFALAMIKLYQSLKLDKEFALANQVLRSGTSIGANVEEAIGGQSRKDFLSKMSIADKEARETHYWIRFLRDSDLLNGDKAAKLLGLNEDLLKIIGTIQKTTRNNS
ncbi:MAG: four helix bundle protein [Cyclobacteriaceae bacterium]